MSSNPKNKWTQNEINLLKKEFKNGTKIKVIASMLGRTETAVNKFLTRYGIRQKHNRITITHNNNPNKHVKKRVYNATNLRWISLLNDVVDFKEIINYLKSKNHKISNIVSENIKMFYPNSQYMLDGKPASKTKLLILANKLREQEHKKIFKVESII